jgi:hypothetical protein
MRVAPPLVIDVPVTKAIEPGIASPFGAEAPCREVAG